MADSYGRPRIEAVASFVLEEHDPPVPPLGPCGYIDCSEETPANNTWEIVDTFAGGVIDRDITEVCTPCANYRLVALASGIGDSNMTGTPTDDAPEEGWVEGYSFSGSTTADPIYDPSWTNWDQEEQASGSSLGRLARVVAWSHKLVFYPIPSGTVFAPNFNETYDDSGYDLLLVKGGGVGNPNLLTEVQGQIQGAAGSGVLSYNSGADWNGVMGNGANSFQIAHAAAWRGKAANCGANFGAEIDGALPDYTLAAGPHGASSVSTPVTRWYVDAPCSSAADQVITGAHWYAGVDAAASVESGLQGVRPGFGAECGYVYFAGATCGAPRVEDLEGLA